VRRKLCRFVYIMAYLVATMDFTAGNCGCGMTNCVV
jgi:hypothetical protein